MLAGLRRGYEDLSGFPFFVVSSQASVLGQRVAVMLLPHSTGWDSVPYRQQAPDLMAPAGTAGGELSHAVRLCVCVRVYVRARAQRAGERVKNQRMLYLPLALFCEWVKLLMVRLKAKACVALFLQHKC